MYILKYEDLIPSNAIKAPKLGLGGEVRAILRNQDGRIAHDTGWIKNTITDKGIALIGQTNYWWGQLVIGSVGGATSVSQTSLGGFLAAATQSNQGSVNNGSPNFDFYQTISARFNAGIGTGTIREIGVENTTYGAGNLAARQEVTPIVKGIDQVLDVFYRIHVYPDLTDQTGQVVIKGITYDYTARMSDLDIMGAAFSQYGRFTGNNFVNFVYDGVLGALDGKPTGIERNSSFEETLDISVAGQSDWRTHWGLDHGNLPGGYVTAALTTTSFSISYNGIQCSFAQAAGQPNPGVGIAKDETQTMYLDWRLTWARH